MSMYNELHLQEASYSIILKQHFFNHVFLFGSMMNHGITIVEKLNVHAPTFMILYVSFFNFGNLENAKLC